MNNLIVRTLGSSLLALGLCVGAAEDPKPASPPSAPGAQRPDRPGRGAGPGGQRVDRVKQLTEQLGLSTDQAAKLRPIFAEETKKRTALREDTSLSPADRRAKTTKLTEETRQKIVEAKILTDDQLKKWDTLREEQRKRSLEGRQRGGGQGGQGGPGRGAGRGNRGGGGNGSPQ